jgi:DNA replication and repair protein RecF
MILTELLLKNFRNHAATHVIPVPGINALLGKNGQGKTNILEAVSYLGLTKSFHGTGDAAALRIGTEAFDVVGRVRSASGVSHEIRIRYEGPRNRKSVLIDGVPPETLASVIGRFPVVVLSPEHGSITAGSPSERRRFLDIALSQVGASYLNDLLEYRRVLRQRNRILADGRGSGSIPASVLDPWTEALVARGSKIAARRALFVREFIPYVKQAYRSLVASGEEPELRYSPGLSVEGSEAEIGDRMAEALGERQAEERRRGLTVVGPHRDDLILLLNGTSVQEFASQGQHKSFLLAMKIAEMHYLRERLGEPPILLLDDLFSELDDERSGNILRLVGDLGQAIVTATDERVFHNALSWDDHHRRFWVEQGTCRAA